MYDRHLDTFLQVADSGSFLKASEKLFISANAVTKQINLLESDLGVKLFRRSTQGQALTEAGKLIYAEAKKLNRHTNSVLKKIFFLLPFVIGLLTNSFFFAPGLYAQATVSAL